MLNLLLQYERKQRRIFLFNYTEDLLKTGLILNFFMSNIVFPSSEDCKNLSVYIRKHKGGFLLKCLYGGGDDIYSRSCYFKCANEDLYLYEVVGTHEIPNSNKKVTERKNIQPQISIGSFDILRYLENTP